MTALHPLDVRCAGCGRHHSREFIRCAHCKTLTRDSLAQQPAPWPEEEPRRFFRGLIIGAPIAAAIWALIWWALS